MDLWTVRCEVVVCACLEWKKLEAQMECCHQSCCVCSWLGSQVIKQTIKRQNRQKEQNKLSRFPQNAKQRRRQWELIQRKTHVVDPCVVTRKPNHNPLGYPIPSEGQMLSAREFPDWPCRNKRAKQVASFELSYSVLINNIYLIILSNEQDLN